jgi:hypothetical protein
MRLEVFDVAENLVFDSGFQPGNIRQWTIRGKFKQAVPDGTYQLAITIREFDGRLS